MRLYESVCILHPSKTDEETGKVVEKMKEILERSGGTIVKLENEGKFHVNLQNKAQIYSFITIVLPPKPMLNKP